MAAVTGHDDALKDTDKDLLARELPRTMSDIDKSANGGNPVTRRECGLIHDTLVEEVRMQVRHLKWYIGGVTGVLTTLVVVSITLIQTTLPKEIPPEWFLQRVERIESDMKRSFDQFEDDLDTHRHQEDSGLGSQL